MSDVFRPIPFESLNGMIARYAASEWIDRMMDITEVAGITNGRQQRVGLGAKWQLERVAERTGIELSELEVRAMPLSADGATRSFFGTAVSKFDIDLTLRRFSPTSLRRSPHHRATNMLRAFPFCPESFEILTAECPAPYCGATQRWYHTIGVDLCDQCGGDLALAEPMPVPDHLRPNLLEAIGLVHPEKGYRTRADRALPDELLRHGRAAAYELLIRLVLLIIRATGVSRIRALGVLPTLEMLHATAQAWDLMKGWPAAFDEFAGSRIATRLTPKSDGNNGHTMRFLRIPKTGVLAEPVRELIRELKQRYDMDGVGAAEIRSRTVEVLPATQFLCIGTGTLATFRREGLIKAVFGIKMGSPIALCDRPELESLSMAIKSRLSIEATRAMLGISYHGVEQLLATGDLASFTEPFMIANYPAPQVTVPSMEELIARLDALSRSGDVTWPRLHRAVAGIGGRMKPWSPILRAVISGEVEAWIEDGPLPTIRRIRIKPEDVDVLWLKTFDRSAHQFAFSKTVSKADCGETLNIKPHQHTQLLRTIPSPKGTRQRVVEVHYVEKLARTRMSATELGARLRRPTQSAYAAACRDGVPWIDFAGFDRDAAEAWLAR